MRDDKLNPQEIFSCAIEIDSAEEQQVFLEKACIGDEELRAKIEDLIRSFHAADGFLEKPIAQFREKELSDYWDRFNQTEIETTQSNKPEDRPTEIGPYKLLQQIGEGGMGSVFMAQQEQPVKRRVALKVIKSGMDSKQVIARFEAERQALAMMDHPNIARLLDVGTTDNGSPYFVMELVKGIPITEYCDQNRLNVEQRLKLFILVCNAVQHAHQKGIIHRDLKPNNILVAEYDEKVVPKIIDFGLAKALGQSLTDKTMFTQFGQVMGTLAYMSPEQSKMNGLDVDTRADIYSLGVLLYELLTGNTPFNKKRMSSAALDQVLKIIREEDPPRPSLRLSTQKSSVEIANHRGVDPKLLGSLLRGDLDWIVMKAMEKERNRRYDTANGLGIDIQRYIDGDPVSAAPPSAAYVIRKFVNRNRVAVAVAGLMLLMLIAGIGGTTLGLFEANRQKQIKSDFLYVAHMNMIQDAWESGLPLRVRELLDRAEPDSRTFEWDYFDSLCDKLSDVPTIRYGDKIVGVAADPTSNLLALAGDDGKIQFWTNSAQPVKVLELDGHPGSIQRLAYSANGEFLLACGRGFARVWKKLEGGFEAVFQANTDRGIQSQFSPDGEFVAVYQGNSIELYVTSTQKCRQLEGHVKPVTDICFTSDSKSLLSSSADGTVRRWNLAGSEAHELLVARGKPIDAIELANDNRKFAFVCGNQLSIQELSVDAPEQKLNRLTESAYIESLNDGRTLAVVMPTEIAFWNFLDNSFLGRLTDPAQFANGTTVDPSGKYFLTHGTDSLAYVWDVKTLKLFQTIRGHSNAVYGAEFLASDGLVTVSRDNSAKIWETLQSTSELRLNDGPARLWSISFSMDNRMLAVAGEDSRIVIWDPRTGAKLYELNGHRQSVQFVRFSPDGKTLASASQDGSVRLWDLGTRRSIAELKGHGAFVNSLDFSRDGKRLVSGSNAGVVIIWELVSKTEQARLVMPEKRDVWAVSFGADGNSVAFGGTDQRVYRWEIDSGNAPELLHTMSEDITSLDDSPDGKWLSVTTADGSISILGYSNGRIRNQLDAHSGDAMFATYSPDGRTLVSGGKEGNIHFWNVKTGEHTVSFRLDGVHIHSVTFSPDGKSVAAARWDGTARIWKVE